MKPEFNLNELATHPGLAAIAGALLGLKALPGATIWERLANVSAGFFIAVFAGPALVEQMEVSSLKIAAGIIFGMGAAGLVIFGAIIEAIRKTDLGAWVSGWLPRKKGGE